MRLIIFTYAPAGLGHLRVTDALADARPKNSQYLIFGSYENYITWAHRFTSLNPFGKLIFNFVQYGWGETLFTNIYRKFLVITAWDIHTALLDVINKEKEANEIIVVATHFGMAHQIGSIKKKLEIETGKKILLVVQVTDDTTQQIWCVKGADLTIVPSHKTKEVFEKYAKEQDIEFSSVVCPYPISPILAEKLDPDYGERYRDFKDSKKTIRISIPISGAATGLAYTTQVVSELSKLSKRFQFWILVKESMYSKVFIAAISSIPGVVVITGKNDNQMVALYELMYKQNLMHLEITKPSEQAFKALTPPDTVGGSILLFSEPVGRQEIENVEFMERHGLVWHETKNNVKCARAIKLPDNAADAAKLIKSSLDNGLFLQMSSPYFRYQDNGGFKDEIGNNGAALFWDRIEDKFGK